MVKHFEVFKIEETLNNLGVGEQGRGGSWLLGHWNFSRSFRIIIEYQGLCDPVIEICSINQWFAKFRFQFGCSFVTDRICPEGTFPRRSFFKFSHQRAVLFNDCAFAWDSGDGQLCGSSVYPNRGETEFCFVHSPVVRKILAKVTFCLLRSWQSDPDIIATASLASNPGSEGIVRASVG